MAALAGEALARAARLVTQRSCARTQDVNMSLKEKFSCLVLAWCSRNIICSKPQMHPTASKRSVAGFLSAKLMEVLTSNFCWPSDLCDLIRFLFSTEWLHFKT